MADPNESEHHWWVGDGSEPGGRVASWRNSGCWGNYSVPDSDDDWCSFGSSSGEDPYRKGWTVMFGGYYAGFPDQYAASPIDAVVRHLRIFDGPFTFNLGPGLGGTPPQGDPGVVFQSGSLTVQGDGVNGHLIVGDWGDNNAELTISGQGGSCYFENIQIAGNSINNATGVLTFNSTLTTNVYRYLTVGHCGKAGVLNIINGATLSAEDGYGGGTIGYYKKDTGVATIGIATVAGTGSTWNAGTGDLSIGWHGDGTLYVIGDGVVSNARGNIGYSFGSTGTVTVDGSGSTWTNNGALFVGVHGNGMLNITNGGAVSNSYGCIGGYSGSTGTVTVDGSGSTWTTICDDDLGILEINSGTLTINNGGEVVSDFCIIGSNSEVAVDGNGSIWYGGSLEIGNGTMAINNGGTVRSDCHIGSGVGTTGTVTVDGSDATLDSFILDVGYQGNGILTITGGGTVCTGNAFCDIGDKSGSTGEVTVDGSGSAWLGLRSVVRIGAEGNGAMTITGGGAVSFRDSRIGYASNATGIVSVDGTGSKWASSGSLHVGSYGNGTLDITNGGAVSNSDGYIGRYSGSTGTVTVDGSGSTWTSNDILYVGVVGNGALNITNGGAVSNSYVFIGGHSGSTSAVTVDGNGSTWTNIGLTVDGTLDITNGGAVSSSYGDIGVYSGTTGIVVVDGNNSSWTNSRDLIVGSEGSGTLAITNGGAVSAKAFAILGYSAGSSGDLTINGDGSLLAILESGMTVGKAGDGTLAIEDGGCLASVKGRVAQMTSSQGKVVIDGGSWNVDLVMTLGGHWGDAADGGVAEVQVIGGGQITVGETLEWHNAASITIDSSSSVIVGDTEATLGALSVGVDGVLMGNGELDTNVLLEGGELSPGFSAGALHILGDLEVRSGTIVLEVFGDGTADQLIVDGNIHCSGSEAIELVFVEGLPRGMGQMDLLLGHFAEPASVKITGIEPGVVQVAFGSQGLSVASVPEPATAVLLLTAIGGFFVFWQRWRAVLPAWSTRVD